MFKTFEGHFKSYDGSELFYRVWSPQQTAAATLIITHGQGEHSGCYLRLVEALAHLPIEIYAWDMRGHGRSDGQRGYAPDFQAYIRDYEAFVRHLVTTTGLMKKSIFLAAHSMGALVQFRFLCENTNLPIQAQILSSPLFGVTVPVPAFKQKAAQFLNKYLPKLTVYNEIRNEELTRDPNVLIEFEKDFYRHNRISSGVYLGSLESIDQCFKLAQNVKVPTLMVLAEDDKIVSSPKSLELFQMIGASDKDIKIYPERKHELINDIGREEVFADILVFLNRFLKT